MVEVVTIVNAIYFIDEDLDIQAWGIWSFAHRGKLSMAPLVGERDALDIFSK